MGAHVNIELLRTNQRGTPHLELQTSVNGMVPQLYSDTDGHPIPGTEQDLYIRVFFGDGSPETGSDGGGVSCKPGAPLVPIHMTSNFSHDYATSGSYTVTYKIAVCQLGVVTKTTIVTA